MKNFTVIHILLFLLLMLVYRCANAQDYLVTARGDTVRGQVKLFNYAAEKKIQVTGENQKEVYPIHQARVIMLNGERIEPVKYESRYIFMKLMKEGYLSLYAFQLPNQMSYDGLFLLKRDGSFLEVPNLAFKKLVSKFVDDCPLVKSRVEDGTLTKRVIDQLVDEYNACVNNRTATRASPQEQAPSAKLTSWQSLEEKVRSQAEFKGKTDALEMIAEIRKKVRSGEKIPNFLKEGLKNAVDGTSLSAEVETALNDLDR